MLDLEILDAALLSLNFEVTTRQTGAAVLAEWSTTERRPLHGLDVSPTDIVIRLPDYGDAKVLKTLATNLGYTVHIRSLDGPAGAEIALVITDR